MSAAELARDVGAQSRHLLGAIEIEDGRGQFPMTRMFVARVSAPRVALVGDAAHAFPPIGAQGLNLGLRDVEDLIAAVTDARAAERDIGGAEELRIAALRPDGTLRKPVIIWVVRAGDDLFVRSAYGHTPAWYRATRRRSEGQVSAAGIVKDVSFQECDPADNDRVDAAYRDKYRRHGQQYVDSVTNPQARATTIKLVPR